MTLIEDRTDADTSGRDERRARLRRWLHLAGIAPLVLALGFGIKVIAMNHHDQAGQDAWDVDEPSAAMEQWEANLSLNLLQPWIAPFDTGNAAYGMKDWKRAEHDYEQALSKAPRREQCTVRINLSLTQEAVGDQADAAGRHDDARKAWRQAIRTLTAGNCPTRAGHGKQQSKQAQSERLRLEEKLRETPPPKPKPPPPPPQSSGESSKEKQLDQNNNDGESWRKHQRDLDDYGGVADDPQW